MEDSQIIRLYWQRNTDAIKETDRKYGAYCFAIANNILRSAQDSEECVNDTWLSVWDAVPPQKPKVFRMFLAKITRNLSINRYCSRGAQKRGGGETALVLEELRECISDKTDVAGEYEAKELGKAISAFAGSLPARECSIFLRRYFFTESVAQIAKRYGITENNTSVILSRTRSKLKAHLIREGFINE